MKILIIDDETLMCTYISDLLVLEGHATITAYSVDEAKKVIERETFDIALVDFQMLDGEGTEIVRRIRKRRPVSKVIGMSGTDRNSKFLEAGADSFIMKPVTVEKILEVI